jgi:uroporphyrin-III C-methyltransferase
LNKPNVHLQL